MTIPHSASIAADLAADLEDAFPRYVRALADGIYTGALRMLGDREEAEDVLQETFLKAYASLRSYPEERVQDLKAVGWTWTIAANLCRNRLRSRRRRPGRPLEDRDLAEPAGGAPPEGLPGGLTDALAALPFPQRAAVVMRHVLDLAYDEISSALQRPVGTVKADVHRGLARLRQSYSPSPEANQ